MSRRIASRLTGVFALLVALAAPARADGTYEVFALPLLNPEDGPRTIVVDPDLLGGVASPFGWHDTDGIAGPEYTITRGNNVHAYLDVDGNNVPDANGSPDGGASLSFLFPLDLGQDPQVYAQASVTNAFYVMNAIHDILYSAGFDEASGNFQQSNYGRGGIGGDAVQLEIQDGLTTNNANWAVDADGIPPRFQVGRFTVTSPDRDGALSNDLLGFLYGQAMARRLIGGPANPLCLLASESAGMAIGWGDWVALVLTAKPGDAGSNARPIGTYVLGQPPSGNGIRPTPYSTSFAVNPVTYGDLGSLASPHGVGYAWATMLWEVYWELVTAHGFAADLNGSASSGGNVLALHLVVEAMKRMPCSPGFVEGRNALLEADQALTGGGNCERIWAAFAKRGLGYSASQGSSSSTSDGTEAFDLPPAEACEPVVAVDPAAGAASFRLTATNPFRDRSTITLISPREGPVRVSIFDVTGREVGRVVDEVLRAGTYEWVWTPSPQRQPTSSVLFVQATVGEERITRKIIRIR